MTYLTPLEICLETELAKIGLVLEPRKLLHEKAINEFLSEKAISEEDINKIKNKKIREIHRKRSQVIKPDWSDFIVYRESNESSKRIYITYSIFPSEENELEFNSITLYDDYKGLIDNILRKRTFYSEEVKVNNGKFSDILTPEILSEARQYFEEHEDEDPAKLISKHAKHKNQDIDSTEPFLVGFDFYDGIVDTWSANSSYDYIFKDIKHPIDDAYLVAKRIAEFVKNY